MKLKGEYILKISADIYKLASSSQSKAKSSQSRLKSPTSPTSFLHESIAQHKMRTQCGKTSQTPDFGAYACRMLCVLPHLQTQIRTRSGAYTVVDCPTQLAKCFITNIKRNTAELSARVDGGSI